MDATGSRLAGRRVLVTSCDTYMGPPIVELFRAEGAEVVGSLGDAISQAFGSFADFKAKVNDAGVKRFGSG